MSEGLFISRGERIWLSPNVWCVPISNPDMPSPGEVQPSVDGLYFLKANVTNPTEYGLSDWLVYFYWANPALGFTPTTANLVGTAAVTAKKGETVEALCIQEWKPTYVNKGHECIIAAVVEPRAPPPTSFDFWHLLGNVTCRNLAVIKPEFSGRFRYAFQACNSTNEDQHYEIRTHIAELREIEWLLAGSDAYTHLLDSQGEIRGLGLTTSLHPSVDVAKELRLAAGRCADFNLIGELHGQAALVHVTAEIHSQVVGGLSVLIVTEEAR